jgi:hypothetical protein
MLRFLPALFLFSLQAMADIALPARMLEPRTPAEAWNMIRLARANVERLVKENRTYEITQQVTLMGPALRALSRSTVKEGFDTELGQHTTAAFQFVNLMARESKAENVSALPQLMERLGSTLDALSQGFDAKVVSAELFHCLEHTERVMESDAAPCPQCQKRLFPRRVPYSFIYARPESPHGVVKAEFSDKELKLKLTTKDGKPLLPADLLPMHTELVQVLVDGPEYRHLVASAVADAPGEYVCAWDVKTGGLYRVHVGMTPAVTGLPEFAMIEHTQSGAEAPKPSEGEVMSAKTEGLEFLVSVAGNKGNQLRAGQTQALHLRVQDASGGPVTTLEPLQQAFAHIDAFYEKSTTLLQWHPAGGDILREDLRGGPSLAFTVYSPEPGFLKAYLRVKVDGKVMMVPFRMEVRS